MKLNSLNRLLLCALVAAPSLTMAPVLSAQALEEGSAVPAPEHKEKEEKREHKMERRFEVWKPDGKEEKGPRVLFKKGKEKKPAVKIAFLGVVLSPVDESLGAQLGLEDGVGILVRAVMDDSPAAKAGVMQHDVLHYFNDQLLVNEPQLQTLVRQAGIGSEVKLTLFRRGKSEILNVKLGETLAQEESQGEWEPPMQPLRVPHPAPMIHPKDTTLTFQRPDNLEGELREFQERLQKLHGNAEDMRREIERFTSRMQEVARQKQKALQPLKWVAPDAKIQVQVLTDGDGAASPVASAISTASGKGGTTIITHNNSTRAKWKNEGGSGELIIENGRKTLVTRDAEGKETYSGPVDTPEQREKLPVEVREQLERIEKGVKVEVRSALPPQDAPKAPKDG